MYFEYWLHILDQVQSLKQEGLMVSHILLTPEQAKILLTEPSSIGTHQSTLSFYLSKIEEATFIYTDVPIESPRVLNIKGE